MHKVLMSFRVLICSLSLAHTHTHTLSLSHTHANVFLPHTLTHATRTHTRSLSLILKVIGCEFRSFVRDPFNLFNYQSF